MERLKIRFGLSFWIFLAMATVLRKGYFAIMYFAAVLLHELAHYFVADRLFYRCYEVRVSVFGAVLYGDFTDVYPRDRILIAVAGPAVNFVAAVLCLALWWVAPQTYVPTENFFAANITMGLVNLLPCYPLDGGRVLTGLLEKYTAKAIAYTKTATWIVGFVLFGVFVLSLFVGLNLFAVGLFALGLLGGVAGESGGECYVRTSYADNLWRRRGMEKKTLVFTADSRVSDVAKRMRGNFLYSLDVVDRDLRVVATFDVAQVESLVLDNPPATLLCDVIGNGNKNAAPSSVGAVENCAEK